MPSNGALSYQSRALTSSNINSYTFSSAAGEVGEADIAEGATGIDFIPVGLKVAGIKVHRVPGLGAVDHGVARGALLDRNTSSCTVYGSDLRYYDYDYDYDYYYYSYTLRCDATAYYNGVTYTDSTSWSINGNGSNGNSGRHGADHGHHQQQGQKFS